MAAGLFFAAGPAAADIPAPGLCGADEVGEECEEAVDKDGNELGVTGVCVADQCSRATPSGPMKYACVMCRLPAGEGGAGGVANDPIPPSAGAGNQPSEGGSGPDPVKPTAGSGGTPEPAKGGSGTGGSASTAGKTTKDDSAGDDGGCSIGSGSRRTGVVSAASLLALALVLGRRRLQRRA